MARRDGPKSWKIDFRGGERSDDFLDADKDSRAKHFMNGGKVMRKSIKVILLLFTSAIFVSACGNDPNAANATNFENALNEYYAQMKQCLAIGSEPNDEGVVQEFRADSIVSDNQFSFYKGLVSLGLLETVSYRKNTKSFSGQVTGKADWIGFKFTEWGQTFLRPTELDKGALSTRSPQLCYATPQIVEIMTFTKPSVSMDITASNVEYTYKLVNVAPWANDPVLESYFEWLPEILSNQSIQKNDDLVLTKNGWVLYEAIKF